MYGQRSSGNTRWVAAEVDGGGGVRVQGMHRVQQSPRVAKEMRRVLEGVQSKLGSRWEGSGACVPACVPMLLTSSHAHAPASPLPFHPYPHLSIHFWTCALLLFLLLLNSCTRAQA